MRTTEQVNARWFDLSRRLGEAEPKLQPYITAIGPPQLKLDGDHFRSLASAILSQQLATKVAETIVGRVAALYPPFPKPKHLAGARIDKLRRAGCSRAKAVYLKSLAKKWEDKKWRRGWHDLEDAELIERLVEVKGIGVWTAQMFLIFSLGRPNVLPVLDFGVRKGLQLLFELDELPHPKAVPELVPHWAGMSSVASWYLWKSLDKKLLTSKRT